MFKETDYSAGNGSDSWTLLDENENEGSVNSNDFEVLTQNKDERNDILCAETGEKPAISSAADEQKAENNNAFGSDDEPEECIVLRCLGPLEASLRHKRFQVKKAGCLGGRKEFPHDTDFIKFEENTVSRRHFEIMHSVDRGTNNAAFRVRDLGTAGGTYIRIPYGERKQLYPGMMVCFGKHQFMVSSVSSEDPQSKALITLASLSADCSSTERVVSGVPAGIEVPVPRPRNECILTCFAPTGSPLICRSYTIGAAGATIGRRPTNAISLTMRLWMPSGEERVVNVDTAISSEHARVEFEPATGHFFICDGTPAKASTNGTWYRLSGPGQESATHELKDGMQIVFGTLRFEVKMAMANANSSFQLPDAELAAVTVALAPTLAV